MMRYVAGLLLLLVVITPLYAGSTESIGFSVTMGETTYSNNNYKNTMINYFENKTTKNISETPIKIITASEVNMISQNFTGITYNSNQIFSCAMVDLSYSNGIKVDVDKNKIKLVTPQMYATALESSGIDTGYVVVSSPVSATGEAALAGVLKSYEIAVGASIPPEAKKASTEELYVGSQLVNETGEHPDDIAVLFSEVKNQTQNKSIRDPSQIKPIVEDVAQDLNIMLNENQAQEVAQTVANSQRVKSNLTEFKDQLDNITQQVSKQEIDQSIISQITSFLQWAVEYLGHLIFGQ